MNAAMTNAEYRALRETVGSQARVAEVLGLNLTTIQRREAGTFRISREAAAAMKALANNVEYSGRLVGKMGRPFAKKD
jgi:DNA-binding transcriptional regulator YiaG